MQSFFLKYHPGRLSHTRLIVLIISLSVIAFILGSILTLVNKMSTYPRSPLQVKQLFSLTLESPIDSQVIADRFLLVKGKTLPNTTIFVYTENDINSVESNWDGKFEEKIQLATGLNTLVVKAFSENGDEKNVVLDVVSDSQSSKVKGESTSKDEPPGQEKKQEAQSNSDQPPGQEKKSEEAPQMQSQSQAPDKASEQPIQTAIVGNVEQVTTTSVVVEEKISKQPIETKVDQNTLITNQDDKIISLDKIKQNDKAAVITKDNKTLYGQSSVATDSTEAKKASKIFVKEAETLSQSKRHAIQGVITYISGNLITIVHQIDTNRIYRFLVDKDTAVKMKDEMFKVSDLRVQQTIAVVGDLNDNGMLVAKLIHIIPSKSDVIIPLSPTPTLTPISTLTPSPTSLSPTVTSFPSGSLSATPIPTIASGVCKLISAKWITPSTGIYQTYAGKSTYTFSQGTSVGLSVTAEGDCVGKQVNFEVRENDSLFEGGLDESANIQPPSVIFPEGSKSVLGTWTAEWQQDCFGLCAPPEYYFNATVVGNNTTRSADPYLFTFGSIDVRTDYANPSVASDGYLNIAYKFSSASDTIPIQAYVNTLLEFWYDDKLIYSNVVASIPPQTSQWSMTGVVDTRSVVVLVTPGTHKVKVCIDTKNVIVEPDEVNNCKEAIFTGPTSTLTGSSGLADVRTDYANPSVTTDGYLNVATKFSATNTIVLGVTTNANLEYWFDDRLIYANVVVSIPPQTTEWSTTSVFDTRSGVVLVTAGTHKVKVCVDTKNQIVESDETNNCKETVFTGPSTPTSTYSAVDIRTDYANPSVASQGYLNIAYKFSASNTIVLGTTTSVQLGFWYDDQLVYANVVVSIPPQTTEWSYSGLFDTRAAEVLVTPGTHKVKVCIDTKNLVIEGDETNNCKETTFAF